MINNNDLFTAGPSPGKIPEGDTARQAVHSLRGYAYQVLATALAWVDIDEHDRLFLEVAEDYAVVAQQALSLKAVQVKDTERSGSVTLKSESVRNAVEAFVDLVERNPRFQVVLHFWTTSEIGIERNRADRPTGIAGLEYWRKVAAGADISPLRSILEERFSEPVRAFCKALDDDGALRRKLIQRIEWYCGEPDLSTLRQELEERLVVVGRDRFSLPAKEAKRLADTLIYRVLQKSVTNTPRDRVLTRADLYCMIDEATLFQVQRSDLDNFLRLSNLHWTGSPVSNLVTGNPPAIAETEWLIDESVLPNPQGIIARPTVESQVANVLENLGVVVLVGSSGLGKSIVSRTVAVARTGNFFTVNFRSTDANEPHQYHNMVKENCQRLDMLFARIGGLPSAAVILEDLNCIDDPSVALSLARVIESIKRRNRYVFITCYRAPSVKVLNNIGLDQNCIVDCPYFSEEEVQKLISENEGDQDKWGRVAYIVGRGHPQLTHAFVAGIAKRGWPIEEISDIIDQGLSSEDTNVARDEVRRSLIRRLPEEARKLLYRLSLVSGYFDRSLSLTIGELSPSVDQAGECMDQLVGPWLENVGIDLFRVSPLVKNCGYDMLSPYEQQHIHKAIATNIFNKQKMYASELGQIMVHALLGKSPESLIMLAQSIIKAEPHNIQLLTRHVPLLYFQTDNPIYSEDTRVSGILRYAQFKLAVAAGATDNISDIVTALSSEISLIEEDEFRHNLEAVAFISVLGTIGIANYFDNWINLLLHVKGMIESNKFAQTVVAKFGDIDKMGISNFLGGLFSVGSANINSVERLEHVINELDKIEASERFLLLTPTDDTLSDYSILINSPWAKEENREDFDAANTAIRYQRMAKKTRGWDIRPLALRCSEAQAIILDEYQDNKEGALAVLEEAGKVMGNDLILDRAKARIYWRHGEYKMAVNIFRNIVDQFGDDSPVRRKSALREAAISAAKCGDWLQAEQWFLDAQSAARSAQSNDMNIIAIGLGADSAVAAFETGDVQRALTRLAKTLQSLADVDPEETLLAAYCHRIIRHTVLWVKSRIEESDTNIDGQPIRVEPGICSNSAPSPAIQELPLGHIDLAWYLLAETEIAAGLDTGLSTTLHDQLVQGPIPILEAGLRKQTIQTDIDRIAPTELANHFTAYVEAAIYVSKEARRFETTLMNPTAPERGHIPTLDMHAPFDSVAEMMAKDAILAYGICAALANRLEAMAELETVLNNKFGGHFPGKPVFDHWNEKSILPNAIDQYVVNIIKELLQKNYMVPKNFFGAGAWLLQWINQSDFRPLLTPRLAIWLRSGWTQILATRLFHLSRPLQTTPPIKEVLQMPANDRSFVAKIILVTSDAVGTPLAPAYRDSLKTMAEESESPSTTQDSPPDLERAGKEGS